MASSTKRTFEALSDKENDSPQEPTRCQLEVAFGAEGFSTIMREFDLAEIDDPLLALNWNAAWMQTPGNNAGIEYILCILIYKIKFEVY